MHHQPAQLSGGEQQRVAIARAMINKPILILADEPTGNLDPDTSTVVFAALSNLVRNEGAAALIATHNLELAKYMDRVMALGPRQAGSAQLSASWAKRLSWGLENHMTQPFIHLRARSAYSLLQSAVQVKDLVKLAAKHGHAGAWRSPTPTTCSARLSFPKRRRKRGCSRLSA